MHGCALRYRQEFTLACCLSPGDVQTQASMDALPDVPNHRAATSEQQAEHDSVQTEEPERVPVPA